MLRVLPAIGGKRPADVDLLLELALLVATNVAFVALLGDASGYVTRTAVSRTEREHSSGAGDLSRNLRIHLTFQIRLGYRFNVLVKKDLVVPPWRGLTPAGLFGAACL